jgi:aryl sulfotransferase
MTGVVWLASYPKSGNTWLRLLLSNLLSGRDTPEDINQLSLPSRSMTQFFPISETMLVDPDILSPAEMNRLLPLMAQAIADEAAREHQDFYIKLHTAYHRLDDGTPLLGRGTARAALYILRDPRDVAVSLAFHNGKSIASTVEHLISGLTTKGGMGQQNPQIRQSYLDWSGHVRSWTRQTDVPTYICRYEDLRADPVGVFAHMVAFLGLQVSAGAIARAVAFADFREVQRQEAQNGFRERLKVSTAPFFRSGRTGGWRDVLSPEQADAIVAAHGEVMAEYNYL